MRTLSIRILAATLVALAISPAAQARPARPDLTVRTVGDPPAFAVPGDRFTATDTTANDGRRVAFASWTAYRLSGVKVGGRLVGRLRTRATSSGSARITVPPWLDDGTYKLTACADAKDWVAESDESDNCRTAAGVMVVDTSAPPPPVIESAPKAITSANFARFTFADDELGVTFTCALDGANPAACESPLEYPRIEDGEHLLELRAVDAAGNASAPVRHDWTVVPDEMTLGDGAWSWFADPRAVHDPVRGRTYVGWVNRDGDVKVAAYDHALFNRVTADLRPRLESDDHANPAIQVLPDGRLRVFYSAHGGARMYYRTSLAPGDVSAWEPEQTVPGNTSGSRGYTYPNPIRLAAERRTYLFWRGGNYNPTFATQDDGSDTWTTPRNLVFVNGQRPYVKYDIGGEDTIHFAFTNAHPREAGDVNIYYAAYRGGAIVRADGTQVGTLAAPITPQVADLVYDGTENAWIHDVAQDSEGHPVIVFARFPTPDDHRYMYARWTGTEWAVREITPAGGSISDDGREAQYSAGITLDHEDPSVVQLSRRVGAAYEVETWRTPDGGATWERRAVTAGSTVKNVRPVTPRGMTAFGADLSVVWMHGIYTSYLDYQTSITTILATGGNAPPIADIELAPRGGPAPQPVAFDGRGSRDEDGTIVDWQWDFGDTAHATGPAATHTYTEPGRYFATLTVVDDGGRRDTAVEEVVISPAETPVVRTGPATSVGDASATLNGTIDPRNQPARYRFEYGPTSAYGAATAEATLDAGLGARVVAADLTGLEPGATYHYRLVGRTASGEVAGGDRLFVAVPPRPSAYREAVMATPGLVAYWRLGEFDRATADDERGQHPGTYAGGAWLGEAGALTGDPDTAVGFDGVSGEMSALGPMLTTARGTVEGWFDWRAGVAVMRDDTSTAGVGWIMAFDSSGRLFYRIGGTNFNTGRTTASVLGRWHHVAVTYDGSAAAFYLDGVRIHTAAAAVDRPPTMPWHVMRNGNHPTQFTAGWADEVAVYDQALPADAIEEHYRIGTGGG